MKVAASPRSMTRSLLFWHSLSHIRRFSPLRMTKRGDARLRCQMSPRILVSWSSSHSSLFSNFSFVQQKRRFAYARRRFMMMVVIRHHAKLGEDDSLVSPQSLVTSCYFRIT